MKPLTVSILAGGCALAAWAGWSLGRRPAPVPAMSAAHPEGTPVAAGGPDYSVMARPHPDLRAGSSVTDILAMAKNLRTRPSPESCGEILALLRQLTPDEISEALEALKHWPPPVPAEFFAAVLGRQADFDPAGAMAAVEKLTGHGRNEARLAVVAAWAKRDPRSAWQWYQKAWAAAPDPRYQLERCFLPLIHGWATQDPKAALEACLSEDNHGTLDPWAGFASLAALPDRRDEILTALTGIADPKKRVAGLRSALGEWSSSDPVAAAAWLDAYPDRANDNLVWAVAERFGRMDPRASAEWLWNRAPEDRREKDAVGMGLSQWAWSDPAAAGEWLASKPHGDAAREIMVSAWSMVDLDRALEWAAQISPEKRTETIVTMAADLKSRGKADAMPRLAAAAGLTEVEFAVKVAKVPMRL